MQIEYIGNESFNRIQEILDKIQGRRVLLVTGKKSFALSKARVRLDKILSNKLVCVFNNFQTNPKIEDVERGISIIKYHHPDLVIAIGGGSVLDMAKLINVLVAQHGVNPTDVIKNSELITNKGKPLVAIPTTSGSGSQATKFAVVYIEKRKYSLAHEYILPDYSIVDSNLGNSAPKEVATSSAMDALSQAIESFWSLNATHKSKQYAAKAIRLILDFVDLAINKSDKKALQQMSLAAHLSGKAINITKTTAPHAISYVLTSDFSIPHGQAVSLLLPSVVYVSSEKHNQKHNDSLNEIFKFFNCKTVIEFCIEWESLMSSLELNSKLEDFDVTPSDLDLIASMVNNERLKNHPVLLDSLDLKRILQISLSKDLFRQ
jgi:alcohol dehydrogenase